MIRSVLSENSTNALKILFAEFCNPKPGIDIYANTIRLVSHISFTMHSNQGKYDDLT